MRIKSQWLLVSILVIAIDQLSKYMISHTLKLSESIPVFSGFLDFTLRHNTGAAFSFLADASGWQRWFLAALALVISTVIICWLYRLSPKEKLEGFALSLVLGGALGNFIDRILYGYVIDFILVYHRQWEFPDFNIADSAITIGIVLLIPTLFKKDQCAQQAGGA